MLIAAVVVAVVGIFGLVGAMDVPAYLIVDVETHGAFRVEDRVVAEDKCIR